MVVLFVGGVWDYLDVDLLGLWVCVCDIVLGGLVG